MPTATLNDEDFKKYFQDLGFNCNTIIRKSITDKNEIEIVWTYKELN